MIPQVMEIVNYILPLKLTKKSPKHVEKLINDQKELEQELEKKI